MHKHIWIIPLLPLAGAAINGLLGRYLRFSERAVASIAVGSVALAFLLSLAAVVSYGYGDGAVWPKAYVTTKDGWSAYSWIPGGALEVSWSYQLDALSAVFMLIITGVGLCIFIFAIGYMHGDAGVYRFFAYLGLFMFSMLVLVMGSNFVMMFVGWEGVGLCSYLLIGYYFDRDEAGNAARKAFVVNRIGDFGLILGIFGILGVFGSAEFGDIMERSSGYALEPLGTWGVMSWIALALFVGACGKSAQIPLFVWLPDAMAGPTPVSALIHAATMVTAGLYLLARTNVIFLHSQTMLLVVAVTGAATALFAATIAITQTDIKKVLAYSTVSQLGLMFMACGAGAFTVAIFHVTTHAFFKALLFLGAGSVIHAMRHEQDLHRMGGLRKYMPYTYFTFLAGWLAICGVIPLSGFWSKDEILWSAASTSLIPGGWLLWLVGTGTALCTAFYMTRLVALVFWGKERFLGGAGGGGQADEAHAHEYDEGLEAHDAQTASIGDRPRHEPFDHVGAKHPQHGHGFQMPRESPRVMWMPLAVLAVLASIGGLVGVGPAFGFLTGASHPGGRVNIVNWLEPVMWNAQTKEFGHSSSALTNDGALAAFGESNFNLAHAAEEALGGSHQAAEWLFLVMSLLAAALGMGLAYVCYVRSPASAQIWAARLNPLYRASLNKYWIDEAYGFLITRRVMDAARAVRAIDANVVDRAVNGSAFVVRALSRVAGWVDRHVIDEIVNGAASFVRVLISPMLRRAQTGLVPNYALVMVIGLVAALVFYFGADIFGTVKRLFAS